MKYKYSKFTKKKYKYKGNYKKRYGLVLSVDAFLVDAYHTHIFLWKYKKRQMKGFLEYYFTTKQMWISNSYYNKVALKHTVFYKNPRTVISSAYKLLISIVDEMKNSNFSYLKLID